ncbi:MAG: response regulator [Polyangiales bacterium]
MPKTLLAVDDSVTMRKVVEMTFAGEDVRVLTVPNAQDALSTCRREPPDVVIADVALDGYSGYDLCRAIKDEFGKIPVVLMSSKQNPFDPARGQASGADDHLDKPYDTAKAIELVKKVLQKGISVAPAPIAAAPIAHAPAAPRTPMFASPTPIAIAPVAVAPVAAPPPQPSHSTVQGMIAQRPAPPPSPVKPALPALSKPAVTVPAEDSKPALRPQSTPALRPQSTVRMTSDAPPSSEHVSTGAAPAAVAQLPPELAGKLEKIGLTPAQVDAVLALSKDIVEKVVWEVVPVLAETLIKEEIARLTKD